jgi:hypothetical protein
LAWQAVHSAAQNICSQLVQSAPGPPVVPDEDVVPDDELDPLVEPTL